VRHPLRIVSITLALAVVAAAALWAQERGESASAAWSPLESARVRVWSDRGTQPASGTLPFIRITLDGQVQYHPAGSPAASSSKAPLPGGFAVVIELKDVKVAPIPNPTKYPLAFPRPNVKKVLENDRVLIWDYTWTPGVPTPMHFHDKDVVVCYLADGELRSTEPDGKAVVNPHYFGFTKLNAGNRAHTEELIKGTGRAIIVELK